ncbi:MAG: hypothetical protein QW103_01925 [Candidatus Pacearchaeota archaeon]
MVKKHNQKSKKIHLEKFARQTKWAPFWAIVRKFGKGKKIHPAEITHIKRNWKIRKLNLKPKRIKKDYLG